MEDKIDEFEEEVESLEKEEKSKSTKKETPSSTKEVEVPTERYVAFYQEEKIGIMDTITREIVIEGLANVPTASLEAFKLNKLDKIGTVTGVA